MNLNTIATENRVEFEFTYLRDRITFSSQSQFFKKGEKLVVFARKDNIHVKRTKSVLCVQHWQRSKRFSI